MTGYISLLNRIKNQQVALIAKREPNYPYCVLLLSLRGFGRMCAKLCL